MIDRNQGNLRESQSLANGSSAPSAHIQMEMVLEQQQQNEEEA